MRLLSVRSALSGDQEYRTEFWEKIVQIWQDLRGEGRLMPSRDSFSPEKFREYLGRLSFIEVSYTADGTPSFVYRVAGTYVADVTRLEMTGRNLDTIRPHLYRDCIYGDFIDVLERKTPVLRKITLVSDMEQAEYFRMTLPFSDDDDQVSHILTCSKGLARITAFLEKVHQAEE